MDCKVGDRSAITTDGQTMPPDVSDQESAIAVDIIAIPILPPDSRELALCNGIRQLAGHLLPVLDRDHPDANGTSDPWAEAMLRASDWFASLAATRLENAKRYRRMI